MVMNHGFIGFGNLGNAIYKGLKKEKELHFAYFSRGNKEQAPLKIETLEELVHFANYIWLTVRPQDLDKILKELSGFNCEDKIIISPVAGKKIAAIQKYFGKEQPIIRIMPNLAVAYRKSVTCFTSNRIEDPRVIELFALLGKLGEAVKLSEDQFDLFTSLFGSGPAFILAFIQIFKEKMGNFNLPAPLLDRLLLELMAGTVTYFSQNQNNYTIEELIENITSKGGTTQAGLDYFKKHKIGKHFEKVLEAACNRSKEMGV
ncbi:MAG: pyrroline-5-carboxylate reductase dimerization domain-containing protein [Bacteroidales bacterium]